MPLSIYRCLSPGDGHQKEKMRAAYRHFPPSDLPPPVPWHRAVKQLAGGQTSFPSKTMSLVQQAPIHALSSLGAMDCQYPSVDMEGGELISKEHHEEVDNDGIRAIVFTYVIRKPDGWEVTKKIRQKINVVMTNYQQNIRVTNGCEAEVETKCERQCGDYLGIGPTQSVFQKSRHTLDPTDRMLQLDLNNPKDLAVQDALCQVSDNFKSLLSQRQGSIMKMFPDLFAQMRTKSTLIPATKNTEIVMNPDGSTTTRTSSSKTFSSSYSSSDVYVNGVRQEAMSKRRFKAFVEYKGPESGFRMKLTDDAEADLSEDETEEDDFYMPRGMKGLHALTAGSNNDTQSEITDTESEIRPHHSQNLLPDAKKRMEKAWFAAKELVDSEQRYVEKLKLLSNIFRQKVLEAKILDKDKANKLFANINSLYQFHNTHFLPQLMEASRDWHSTKRIANVVRKQAPFLKMYSEYTNNYDRATKTFDECKKKNRKFAEVVTEVERLPDCEGLPLQHHLICPVQRVMRYQLLLQEYKKHLTSQDADFADSEVALNLVLQAATHANEMMKKLEGFGKVIEVQEELGNAMSLVSPGRELLRRGVIQKISSTTEKAEERTLFLFNDLIIMASDKRIGSGKKVRAVFSPTQTQVCEGDNLEREHSFYLRGSDGSGPQRCVELFCDTQREKREWMEGICTIIDDCKANSATFGGSERSSISETVVPSESKHCCDCDVEFSLWSRGIKCGQCRRKLCKKCFGRYRTESKNNRICESCVKNKDRNGVTRSQSMFHGERKNLLSVPATGEGVIHGGWVKFKGSQNKTFERYLTVREDFCMYSYVKPTDSAALLMLPLPGCEVRMCGEAYSFLLKVGTRREYKIFCDSEESQAHWMALLDLAANAQIKS